MSEATIQAERETAPGSAQMMPRSRRPVFVMGCHRSGTNLLYDTLLSAGGFAVYRGYTPVYKMLIPRFGSPANRENRIRLVETWLRSKGYRRSGLTAKEIKAKLIDECHTGGDFIRIILNEISRSQNAQRWAIYDPDNVLCVPQVKADLPEALFVHIIRDGRDIALSLKKMKGFKPLPWNVGSSRDLLPTAAYWEWMVRTGQGHGRKIPEDYIEIRYEDLVSKPHETLATLGRFLDHDLDYDRIQKTGLGRIRETNSSFREEAAHSQIKPMERWKERLTPEQVASLEALVGDCLQDFGYALTTPPEKRVRGLREKWIRKFYPTLLETKLWIKTKTPLGRFANLSAMELSNEVPETTVAR
jgi:LPS sulfotransferase NodH